jgi:hypothetical protein
VEHAGGHGGAQGQDDQDTPRDRWEEHNG